VIKQQGCQADDASTSSAEAKNEWSFTSVPPTHLNDVQRDTFISTIPRSCRQNVNSNDLYAAGTRFKSQPEHRTVLVFLCFFYSPKLAQIEQLRLTTISSFCIYVNLSL
jgi:hypothetical protein